MIRFNFIVLSITGLFSLNSAQLVQFGQCNPNIQLVENFNASQFLGTWYGIARTDNPQQNGDCATLTLTQRNNIYDVKNEALNDNFYEEFTGTATLEQGTAKFRFNMSSVQSTVDFWILMTDYNNFAVGYACENRGSAQRNVYIWQLGRATSYPTEMMEALVNTTISTLLGIDTSDLRRIDHSENACYVLPELPGDVDVIFPGQCDPNVTVVKNFNATSFVGTWHEISRYYTQNEGGACNRAQYALGDGGVNVLNSQVVNRTLQTISGKAVVVSTDGSAKLSVSLEIAPNNFTSSELWIIGTDYENYAVSYSCVNLENNQRRVTSWILSRTKQLAGSAQNAVNDLIRSQVVLNWRYYQSTNQSDDACFYFPEPTAEQPVIFPGRCDMSIPTVQNFDPERYTGLWHDIESYPSTFQQGSCNNALYTLGNGNVLVYNTQVINQKLDAINGVAVLATNDGSAKLRVTFPIAGTNFTTTTDYWVLATDYTTYSLVYTCTNINNEEREVYAWKLSRTKQMPTVSNTAINAVLSNFDVLDQRYFIERDQSPSACFYFPEPQENLPVVFPGQCDESIPTVTNFSMQQFQGVWYEVAAYPKEQQTGQCIYHNYTSGSPNTLNLQSSSVTDQLLGISNGILTFSSTTDSSGRLNIRIQTSSGEINIPFWILSVDYNDYALAYSCVNDGSDYRKVFSWKLSRTKQLSTAANTAINNVITTNVVLDNVYYNDVDQSDRACFYLPDIPAGQPIVLPGQCNPNIAVVQNFNVLRYGGRWRLIESYPAEAQTGTCNEATYTLNNSVVDVLNTQVILQTLDTVTGTARLASTDGSAKLSVTFPGSSAPADYWVLDTDYDSYALVYACRNVNSQQQRVFSWKLSRTRDLTTDAMNKINQVINNVDVLNNRFFEIVDQSDDGCFYYPEPHGGPVIFRGQCDPNIKVVTGFDAQRYMNLWHDIESYPNDSQGGTCPNAFYEIVDGAVDVYNTQVVNQRLDTIRGQATLQDSTDGSAKLNVTFPVSGVNISTDYWVLATDYTSYALVYGCVNIDEEHRRVSSWKLSRTKALTPQASTAISAVINTIPVLNERYYETRDQSVSGCFYYPEPQPGVTVVFPGQCNDSIAAIPNFNLTQFQGIWYETEAYPKEQQTGQCINHQYTFNASSNTLNLESSNVFNENLRFSAGLVTVNSTDSSGRLLITITEANEQREIPFWILTTDYNNYALAYSCENRGSDFRAIHSWKLSRSKQLSETANSAINTAIANIEVLDNRYYESIDQSDNACFYLPQLPAGQPVVFPGQCDLNLTVVQNFNAARYLGRWRMIETYHSDFQSGACNEANYALLPNNTVDVVNTQVVNQALQIDNGNAVIASTDGSAKLLVTFPNAPEPSEYWVLGTDYDNYALVYSCKNIDNQRRRVWSWKLSRATQLSANSVNSINEIVNRVNVLNSRYYQSVSHTDAACFYFPVPSPNTPVIFPGQCDPNIQVVTRFNLTQYLGLWYDIQSYPTVNQYGTCSNARYTLNGSLVDVLNTQVVNQRLDTISGSAALISDPNGSAKVIVTFPINGTDQIADYWVLSTDYNSYALVYSCKNLPDNRRFVGSWKLSRTKQLTTAANTAIANVISSIQVLENRYYQAVDQSPEGCFYYPEPQPGVPVVFPGQCDENIQAIANFNLSQFMGIWHEIQAYPKDQQTGQCVNHQYSPNSSVALNLQSFNVLNETLRTSSGILSINSSDSSGKLTITLGGSDQLIEIPFWILSTDYSNYALVYSCVNQGPNYRAVYSWKLSRTKQLNAAAIISINSAIANIDVLDNKYYESIDQSENACFYLPEIAPGQPVEFPGQCDANIPVVQNFNATRYLGRWRMIETYHSDFQSGACNEANYALLPNNSVDVVNTQVVNQELQIDNGNAVVASTDGSAKLLVTFPNAPEPSEYWVLDTDYDNYALVYSCKNIDNQRRRVWTWKLSRDRQLSSSSSSSIDKIVNQINVLNSRYYQPVVHSDDACFYYPPPNPGVPVVFRGQCDMNIPVVTNFNLTEYLGLWHDIESYPTEFQGGTCGNANYKLNGSVVDVLNTQVVQERLDTIRGVANLTQDPNNSAKIVVSFPIAGTNQFTTADYWVLSTDYSSYALVYSCRNLNTESRQVTSWKLSRTKHLSANAVTAINNVIYSVRVLDARYYQPTDQSYAGCFYFPEPQPGVPVVFPGQCDENIQAVPAFNLSQFQGRWHEIQAYPKDEQSGQCINHQYSAATDNMLNLQSFNVQDISLITSNSVVTLNSTDSSGRLLITLTAGNSQIEIPFWILSTDYTNYALAYSCVNRDQDYRAVYSWKLSRTKQLSAAANNSINNAIVNIAVLNNDYYEDIDQSDNACFYLPNLAPGEPVEFPGQCDNNIPVVTNFDPVRYAGRWRLIETYASEFQSGSCNEATYTLMSNGTVIVYNTQVINQSLDTMTGSAALATADGSGKLLVTFPTSPEPAEYWILDTDYDSYALVYSCRNINNERRQVWSWKLSRTRELTANAIANITQVVDSINVLNNRFYQRIQHSETSCFYYPTPDKNRPVEFRGQCNENVTVVQQFDLEAYMGTWYDIEGYPQGFQSGSCATANYNLTANGVEVFNTQVVNQELDTITAIALPAASDGSAKFTVTFPIAGTNETVSTPYWVLSTDYNNYALVYSCSNIDNENYRVTSWKLSRQRNLTVAANQAISSVMATVPVLRQQYYVERGHSVEDCRFYPENNGGPVILDGECEDQAVVTGFNADAFRGTWYEAARFPAEMQTGQCAANTFSVSSQSTFNLAQTFVDQERLVTLTATATAPADGRGVLNFTVTSGTGIPSITTFNILATDYTSYALLHSCRNLGNQRKQIYSWKLSRSKSGLSQTANAVIDVVVRNTTDLFEKYYDSSDQSDAACFYYPVFDQLPATITLPGRCNATVRAKSNFNATSFAGRWIEISRYPQASQNGQCNRPEYILNNGSIQVINTQVINKTLDVVTGSAVVASTDGSGILQVTFALPGGVVNVATLYILETDYSNYALAYSCRDLPNENRRQVNSWKLSRTATLSNAANNAISAVISSTQGLIEEYYLTTDQSDEACFYIPEVNPEAAPVFRGQCENITGVQGFDIQRYLGWWHEIERFPTDEVAGVCISSDFRASGNQYQVIDTNVFGVAAVVNTTTVTATNDGRLRKTLNDGRVIDIWVLATDYETYSLLYSCENINNEYRRVWSAKHSKSRQLSQAAQDAMAPAIENNRVLYQQFYQSVDQSDSACFHYREQTGNQIILPGQCDLNIPVEQNFDPTKYTGTWYQIERYPQEHERGNCTGAKYTLNEATGVVTVLNWEVIDGVLDTIEGTATVNSTDGSAKLVVRLPDRSTENSTETVEMRLYVLETDYVSYSLAYSCVNINQFQRSIGVWKLSRTRTMPAAGNTAINAYMATREELHQPYFVQVEQNDDCEEPSSAVLMKSSIIVILVCVALQMFK